MRIATLACVVLILFGCTMPGGPPREEYVAKINVFLTACWNSSRRVAKDELHRRHTTQTEIINFPNCAASIHNLLAMPQPHDAKLARR